MELERIQKALAEAGMDGWLFFDFHNRDPIAYRVLGLNCGEFTSRRWFYWIPAKGEPVRLVHRVEPTKLDDLPGEKRLYLGWKELHETLPEVLGSAKKVAMQFSPLSAIPYVSTVDGGTVDLIRSMGVDVVSSGDLVQMFESTIDEEGFKSHLEAGEKIQHIKDDAFKRIGDFIRSGRKLTEFEMQQWMVRRFEAEGLDCESEFPIVGVNEHPANPHFQPTPQNSYAFKKGDMVLIDLWAKLKRPRSIFYDITWCGYLGDTPPAQYAEIFDVVKHARNTGVRFIREHMAEHKPVHGYEVDDIVRKVVKDAGYGESFIHRTGHSIGEKVHGNGVNIDNLETKDERLLVPGICFSIEPGIYLEGKMAARTEINVFINQNNEAIVTGPEQDGLILVQV